MLFPIIWQIFKNKNESNKQKEIIIIAMITATASLHNWHI